MARIKRVMALLDLLRAHQETTVTVLAEELGVSVRTVMRDLAVLREEGHAVLGEAGRGGGIRLDRTRAGTPVNLTDEEIAALFLAATLARRATALPWSGAIRRALDKLLASVPRPRARELRSMLHRVLVGPPASVAIASSAGAPSPELLRCFDAAFRARMGLQFHYQDREGRHSVRRVEPHGLLVQTPVWYILAHDLDRGEPRMFRVDRISRARVLTEHTFVPRTEVIDALFKDIELPRERAAS
ncbi:MAG: WYL domain-containing protein [Myxococcota bacterium]